MRVEIHDIENDEDHLAGILRLQDGRISAEPDTLTLRNILSQPVLDWEAGARYWSKENPEEFLRALHRQYTSAYLRATKPIDYSSDINVREVADKWYREDGTPRTRASSADMIINAMAQYGLNLQQAAELVEKAILYYKNEHVVGGKDAYWKMVADLPKEIDLDATVRARRVTKSHDDGDDSAAHLAQHYADYWNTLAAHGEDVPDEELHAASEELSGTDWRVTRRPDGEWRAHHYADRKPLREWSKGWGPEVEKKAEHAPKVGISISREDANTLLACLDDVEALAEVREMLPGWGFTPEEQEYAIKSVKNLLKTYI